MGASMLDVRSRAGIVAVTTGAALLLALPVVAAGQGPGVGQVVGGVKEKVEGAAPGPPVGVPAPPVNLPAPAAPRAPAPKAPTSKAPDPQGPPPKAQGSPPAWSPAAQAPRSAPPAHGRVKKASAGSGEGGGEQPASAPGSPNDAPATSQGDGSGDGGSKDGGSKAGGGGKTTNLSQDDGAAPTDVEIADQVVEAPVGANPSTLPFTGFQLALMVALGVAAVGTGVALRRGARSPG
jgi:hypothetical protein